MENELRYLDNEYLDRSLESNFRKRLLHSLTQINENIVYLLATKALPRPYSLKIYKKLSLSAVFSNTNSKTFYAGNDFAL